MARKRYYPYYYGKASQQPTAAEIRLTEMLPNETIDQARTRVRAAATSGTPVASYATTTVPGAAVVPLTVVNPIVVSLIDVAGVATRTFPRNTFSGTQELTYELQAGNGSAPPAGITLNSETRTLYYAADVLTGTVALRIRATDVYGGVTTASFTQEIARPAAPLTVVNPIVVALIDVAGAVERTFPRNTFSGTQTLTYVLEAGNGDAAPAGITLNSQTRIITYAAGVATGTYALRIKATDATGGEATANFTQGVNRPTGEEEPVITVDDSDYQAVANQAPVVSNALPDQALTIGVPFSYVIPVNTFSDSDGTIEQIALTGLPAGLSYTASTRTIAGTPTTAATSTATATATDNSGATVSDQFILTVAASTGGNGPSTYGQTQIWIGAKVGFNINIEVQWQNGKGRIVHTNAFPDNNWYWLAGGQPLTSLPISYDWLPGDQVTFYYAHAPSPAVFGTNWTEAATVTIFFGDSPI